MNGNSSALAAHCSDQRSTESVVASILADYLERIERGEAVPAESLLREYPEHAAALEPTLRKLAELHQFALGVADDKSVQFGMASGALDGTLGDFRIVREIGRGGMGVVYEAEQISLRRRVALKVLPFAAVLDPRRLARFANEAQAAALLHHPHVVPIYSVGVDRGVHYYAMQYIEGQSLAEAIEALKEPVGNRLGAVPAAPHDELRFSQSGDTARLAADRTLRTAAPHDYFRTVARLGIQAAEALHYAHQHGILHRDIKPSNLMLDGDGNLWVTDFGLARIQSDATLTGTGDLLGTLRYMSPEQAGGQNVLDERTDVYSLGTTLYEMLTLRPALPEDDPGRLLHALAHTEPVRPRQYNRAIPVDLETIVGKAMAKEAGERYPSPQAMAEDLRRFLDRRPIVARPPSLFDRSVKWARRHRLPVILSTLTIASLAALAIGGWHAASVVNDQLGENIRLTRIAEEGQRAAEARLNKEWRESYVADMEAAGIALADGNFRHVLRLLQRHLPAVDRPDQRDFVWHYLDRQTNCEVARMVGHDGQVSAVAFSSDGDTVVTGGHDGTVRTWYAVSGIPGDPRRGHSGNVNSIVAVPGRTHFISCADDGKIAYWTWKLEPNLIWSAHEGDALCLAITDDGEQLASGGADGVIRLWKLPNGKPIGELRGHSDWIRSLVFSSNGEALFSASDDGTIKHWNLSTRSEIFTFHGHNRRVLAVDLSPDGQTLASGGDDATVRFWNVSTGKQISRLDGHEEWVRSVHFLPDGQSLLSADSHGVVQLWDVTSGQRLYQVPVTHESTVWSADVSADGKRLITAGADGIAKVWRLRPHDSPETLTWPKGETAPLAVSEHKLAYIAQGRLNVGDISPFRIHNVSRRTGVRFARVAITPDGTLLLATFSDASAIGVYQAKDLTRYHVFDASPEQFDLIAVSPDSNHFLASTTDGALGVYRISPPERVAVVAPASGNSWSDLYWSPDGKLLAARSGSTGTTFWNATDFQRVLHRSDFRRALSLSPDGKSVALADEGPNVRLFNLFDHSEQPSLAGHRKEVLVTAFSPDGKLLASADALGFVKLWDVTLGRETLTLEGGGKPDGVQFSLDGRSLLTIVDSIGPPRAIKLLIWSAKPQSPFQALAQP